jgi:hypoxanthine-DNA glycosylase
MRARVKSFAPIIGKRPRVLILGSMPGIASLEAVQYYAHPRNAFWPIMADLFSLDAQTDYAQRIAQISAAPVILWDTLKRCDRPGSLDASIKRDSVEANDIPGLLGEYPGIRAVACNGAASANYFRKLVVPQLPAAMEIELLPMPSTSPANAGMNFAQKLAAWRRLLDYID